MGEFEKRFSCDGLDFSSLLVSNSAFVTVPIRTQSRSHSNANLLDIREDGPPGSRLIRRGNVPPSQKISPKKKFHSMDDIFDASVRNQGPPPFGIMSDCIPSPESDSSYASSSGSGPSSGSSHATCEISLLERLVRSHPIWFLPSLQRSGALHLLQGRDNGNFIVRSSTQTNTMACSVKLPGNNVEHYLLKANGNRISLENSTHTFASVHQLIAHYCLTSDEIPVCLKVPNAIAEATSRQQLMSLALLGQEFWSIPPKGGSSCDTDLCRNFVQCGRESQSSSSHSLSDTFKKPSRPTTLELGAWKSGGAASSTVTPNPPPVPLRWSRSALLSPLSQPSSVQSTPSEVQSTFSEKSGRPRKKKRNSGGNNKAESIHYKDTEILELFKGTKTIYDDKASDYEDVWSPQYHERSRTPKLSTFKPDVIPTNHTFEVDNINNLLGNIESSAHGKLNSSGEATEEYAVRNLNFHNHRLSFNGQNLNINQYPQSIENVSKSNCNIDTTGQKPSGLYSEPVDSITFRKFGGNRNTEPNIQRWSQPTLSLLKMDFNVETMSENDCSPHKTGSGEGKPTMELKNQQQNNFTSTNLNVEQQLISTSTTRSSADVSSANKSVSCKSSSSANKNNTQSVTCSSIDNLCHFPVNFKKSTSQMIDREDEYTQKSKTDLVGNNEIPANNTIAISIKYDDEPPKEVVTKVTPDVQTKSWCLDNSWELVMWQKEEERRLKGNAAKFPVLSSPPSSPKFRRKNSPSESSQTENSLTSTNNNSVNEGCNSLQRRFSCYDNLERSKAETNADEETDSDEDKISPPWDNHKWEHLMRIISESTQQLDLLSSVGSNNNTSDKKSSFQRRDEMSRSKEDATERLPDPILKVDRIQEVEGNVASAGKSVAAVVRRLATKDDGVFGPTLKSFISCTISAKVTDPYKVMRNIRQFISGMKNYLVGVNGETEELRNEIKKQAETLSKNEFLNIDFILEDLLVELVVSPLNLHIRGLIEAYNAKNGEPLQIGNNRTTRSEQNKLSTIIDKFEESVSPITKLAKWNEFVCEVQEMDYSTDTFIPLLSETLRSLCSQQFPSHVDYMIGLLPSKLAEINTYSISMLQSVISTLRVKAEDRNRKGSASLSSVKVIIPDERNATLIRKMVPVRNSTTNKEVAKLVASKLGITNPSDYVLVTIKNGEESICPEMELVYNCVDPEGATALAYKRMDAKIGWPKKIS